MTLLLDLAVHSPSLGLNMAAWTKLHPSSIQDILDGGGVLGTFAFYGFQTDAPGLVGSLNEGTSGVLGNMAFSNIGLRAGNGFYIYPVPGAQGFGMTLNGGASGFFGSVASHSGNAVNGSEKFTVAVRLNATSAGEGGAGTIISKGDGYRLRFSAANTLIFEVWDGAAWRGSTTGANVVYGFWHTLECVYDGTLAAADRIKMYLNGIDVTVPGANIPATITDAGNILYVLDNAGNTAAWDGLLGALLTAPDTALSLAESQGLVELISLNQPTVAQQAAIVTPGYYGAPDYDFDGNDYLLSYQATPIKTSTGTLIIWASLEDFTAIDALFSLDVNGVNDDEYALRFRGDQANDPLEIFTRVNGVVVDRLRFGANVLQQGIMHQIVISSDGTTLRASIDGVEQAIVVASGANTGQWFDNAPDANVYGIAAQLGVVGAELLGRIAKVLLYDEAKPLLLDQQIWQRGSLNARGGRFYPDR
jgi:hypothetical protein